MAPPLAARPRHAVICYNGREGSSPIVWSLSRHPKIRTPLFEELDEANVEAEYGAGAVHRLVRVFARIFAEARYDKAWFDPRDIVDPARPADAHVALKWRPWGDPDAVARQFRASGAVPFLLVRRDVLNLMLSLHYTFEILPALGEAHTGHVQFAVVEMGAEERAAYLARLRARRFHVELDRLVRRLSEFVEQKSAFLDRQAAFLAAGLRPETLVYEDFVADKRRFLTRIVERIGLDYVEEMQDSHSPKVNREDMRDQVENIAEIERSSAIRALLARWDEFCRAMGA